MISRVENRRSPRPASAARTVCRRFNNVLDESGLHPAPDVLRHRSESTLKASNRFSEARLITCDVSLPEGRMDLVEPDLKLGGFSLWVFGRQFPDANDYWDGNWLNVRARVEAPGALVEAPGGDCLRP